MTRRSNDSGTSVELSAAIEVARQQWPDARTLDRVRASVDAAIAAQPAGRSSAKLLRRSLRGALWRGGTALMLLGAGLFGLHERAVFASADADAQPRALPSMMIAVALPNPAPIAPVLATQAVQATQPRAPEARRPAIRARNLPKHVAAEQTTSVSPDAELALLRRALAALKRQPSESLALTVEHARDYPQGIFGQEREVIAIDALVALQETAAAESRARAFLASYPRSSHAPRIRRLLGAETEATTPLRAEQAARETSAAP